MERKKIDKKMFKRCKKVVNSKQNKNSFLSNDKLAEEF